VSRWRHLRAVGLLPGVGAVVVPTAILLATRDVDVGWGLPGAAAALPVLLGAAVIAAGLALMYRTIFLFAREGGGTLAPWDPTTRLVARGPYRRVRNPMITGVLAVLLGECALTGSLALLVWAGIFALANALWMPLIEEPALERRFGDDYREYRRNVPRWLPRPSAWSPPSDRAGS
jgi:protein-S-isoprenylcysteine O-methyltransferase Ste14